MAANPPPAPPKPGKPAASSAPKSGPVGGLQRKLGPLPVWAWALIGLAVGYYVYEHYLKGATAAASTASTANPVPGSDQSTGGASADGGIGTPATTTAATAAATDPNAGENAPGNFAPGTLGTSNGLTVAVPGTVAEPSAAFQDFASPTYTSPLVPSSNFTGIIKGPPPKKPTPF